MRYLVSEQTTATDVQNELNEVLRRLAEESQLATDAGVEQEALQQALADSEGPAVLVSEDGAGADPATVAIVVAFAPVAAGIVEDCWDAFLLPWLRKRFGADEFKEANEK